MPFFLECNFSLLPILGKMFDASLSAVSAVSLKSFCILKSVTSKRIDIEFLVPTEKTIGKIFLPQNRQKTISCANFIIERGISDQWAIFLSSFYHFIIFLPWKWVYPVSCITSKLAKSFFPVALYTLFNWSLVVNNNQDSIF